MCKRDTAGQERFSKITESFYRGAKGVFFVYDITNGKSFDNISRWLRNFDEVTKFLKYISISIKLVIESQLYRILRKM